MSPVVGMVLVLGISIVGIAAILYWGLPAIDEMKANVEHRSVESQFTELDATVKELVAGTTERTAKRWQPTLNRGRVLIANETEAFVYAVETYQAAKDYSFVYAGFTDRDANFTIYNAGNAVTAAKVYAYRVDSTTSAQELRVNSTQRLAGTAQMGAEAWSANTPINFRLLDTNGAYVNITNSTIRLQVYEGTTKIAEAYYVSTGRVEFALDAGVQTKKVIENNGAVLTGNGDTFAMINAPPVPPAANTSGVTRHFARAVVLNGTGSFAGDDRFDVLVTLYSTSTLASYDCADASARSDCVERVKIFAFGTYANPWYSYLLGTARGYTWSDTTTAFTSGGTSYNVRYLQDTEGYMGYTLLQSIVQLVGS